MNDETNEGSGWRGRIPEMTPERIVLLGGIVPPTASARTVGQQR